MPLLPARARVAGSGFTAYSWNFGGDNSGIHVVSFMRQVSHVSPAPVGPGTVPIHPLDMEHPAHLITAQAISMGTLTFELYELIDKPAWQRFAGLEEAVDLVDIFGAISKADAGGSGLSITRFIYSPATRVRSADPTAALTASNTGTAKRVETYNNCVVSQLMDGETIEVGTMEVLKQLVVNYAYVTRDNKAQSAVGARTSKSN